MTVKHKTIVQTYRCLSWPNVLLFHLNESLTCTSRYYLTGQKMSNRIWEIDTPIKAKAKRWVCLFILLHHHSKPHLMTNTCVHAWFSSPAKPAASASGGATRWSKQEKELFEEGLVSHSCHHASFWDSWWASCLKHEMAVLCVYAGPVWSKVD